MLSNQENFKAEKGICDEGAIVSEKDLLNDHTDEETEERYKYGIHGKRSQ